MQPVAQQVAPADPAVVDGWFYVPYSAIEHGDETAIQAEKNRLTYQPAFSEEDRPVRLYRDIPARRMLAVPRAYGLHRYSNVPQIDRMSDGQPFLRPVPRFPDPYHPAVRDPEQQRIFMDDLIRASQEHGQFIAYADTGSGKTVCALNTAARRGRKTVILVHLERLLTQWIKEIESKLGVPRERIGVIQSHRCEWEDKDFVVAMMPSLSLREYPSEMYRAFGTVIVDECHRVGAPLLSRCVPLFPARVRIGLSATPERKDGGDRVFFWHIGPIKVRSRARAMPLTVYVKRFRSRHPVYGRRHGSRVKSLTEDPARNLLIIGAIKRLWHTNRQVLVIGEHVGHLQDLREALVREGIPAAAMAQYTGEEHIRSRRRDKNGNVKRVLTSKRKLKPEEYEYAARHARIIFATYGVFKEGIDIPRLDAGIDVTPISKAKQVVGRVRRPHPNKPEPIWLTIVDEHDWMSTLYFKKRCEDYQSIGARVVESGW